MKKNVFSEGKFSDLFERRENVGIWIYSGNFRADNWNPAKWSLIPVVAWWSALRANNVLRHLCYLWPLKGEDFLFGFTEHDYPLDTCLNEPLSLCQKLSQCWVEKNIRSSKGCYKYITSFPSLWSFPRLLKKIALVVQKSSVASFCKTSGVGLQACLNEKLLTSADAASPPSLLLFTIPPTPRQSCCRLRWGQGCYRRLRLEISAASFAISELSSIR